jgi:3-oxoadipate enol-lactonase
MPEVIHAGARIAYQVEGPEQAPALLFSNSLGSDLDLWQLQVPACVRSFRVIRYDLRGHGRSSVPPGPYTIELLGQDALAVLDAAGVAQGDFVGISIGGLTGLWLGIHAPERVGKLVLANTGAKIGTDESWNQRIQAVRSQGLAAIADTVLGRWFTPQFAASRPDLVAPIRRTFETCNPDGYIGCCEALRDADLRDEIGSIRTPILVITGTFDQSTTPALGQEIEARIPKARLVELAAAHISNIEQADEFNRAMLGYLGF